jgi:iduronate 2-sulfatase
MSPALKLSGQVFFVTFLLITSYEKIMNSVFLFINSLFLQFLFALIFSSLVQAKPSLIFTKSDDLNYSNVGLSRSEDIPNPHDETYLRQYDRNRYAVRNENEKIVKSPNLLFIIADDLMKQVGLYGNDEIKTPNLNKLAQESTLFDRAYCQYPLCGPSRASLMLSKYPDNTGITFNQAGKSSKVHEKAKKMSMMTMPAYFKKHGYLSVGGGKLYHNNVQTDATEFLVDFDIILKNAGRDGEKIKVKDGPTKNKTRITEKSDGEVFEHKDGVLVENAINWLQKYNKATQEKPFFMALGIKKPHSPFSSPAKFWDIYNREQLKLPNVPKPNDILEYSLNGSNGLLKVHPDTEGYDSYTLPEEKKKEIVHGYSACVSYVDFLVGELIEELKHQGLYENTIIVFTSDHGYKLGEYDRWAKNTLHEKDALVPLLIHHPGQKYGGLSQAIVGLVDLYPTIAEMCSLPVPRKIDGRSFKACVHDAKHSHREYIRTVLPRVVGEAKKKVMGVSIYHQKGYRYHHWLEGDFPETKEKEQLIGIELYDHYRINDSPLSRKNIFMEKPKLTRRLRDLALLNN